jgi:hypothetical protein
VKIEEIFRSTTPRITAKLAAAEEKYRTIKLTSELAEEFQARRRTNCHAKRGAGYETGVKTVRKSFTGAGSAVRTFAAGNVLVGPLDRFAGGDDLLDEQDTYHNHTAAESITLDGKVMDRTIAAQIPFDRPAKADNYGQSGLYGVVQ